MISTLDALVQSGFQKLSKSMVWSYKFGEDDKYEITVERLPDNDVYVALYEGIDLLIEKLPFKAVDFYVDDADKEKKHE